MTFQIKRNAFFSIFFLIFLSGIISAEEGLASWYGGKFHGRTTANGETFDTNIFTAAHKTLPFNTVVRVINLLNGETVIVRINDRGPFVEGRVIDLSRAAADAIGMTGVGVAPVRLEIIKESPLPDQNIKTLQIGAFSNMKNAERMKALLKSGGFDPVMEKTPSGIIRVILPGVKVDQLGKITEKLESLGIINILIRSPVF